MYSSFFSYRLSSVECLECLRDVTLLTVWKPLRRDILLHSLVQNMLIENRRWENLAYPCWSKQFFKFEIRSQQWMSDPVEFFLHSINLKFDNCNRPLIHFAFDESRWRLRRFLVDIFLSMARISFTISTRFFCLALTQAAAEQVNYIESKRRLRFRETTPSRPSST